MIHLKVRESNQKNIVQKAVQVLQKGGLVIAPSDTVYGVLVDATNETAVLKLMAFKNRPIGKSISVFVADFEMLESNVEASEQQKKILHELIPGPFTVVLPSKHTVSSLLESEKGTLGVRLIEFALIKELVTAFGKPVTATSANLAGKSPHYSVASLLHQLPQVKKDLIDMIIDVGQLPRNKPSTVIDITTPTMKILRKGDVKWENKQSFESNSEDQTKKIAQDIFNTTILPKIKEKPVVVILKGELGAGKTIFVKGIAEALGIDTLISPTFTIYYEYQVKNNENVDFIYHFDLYNIEDPEEFKHLGIENYLKPGNILFFEWGEKSGEILELLKAKAGIISIEILYTSESTREIKVKK